MKVRRFAGILVVAAAALFTGQAVAQEDEPKHLLRQAWAAEAYKVFRGLFERDDDFALEVRREVYRALDVDVAAAEDAPECAYPVGSGGNPRWDGGGSQVARFSSGFPAPAASMANVMARLAELPADLVPARNIVIIDEFHLGRLETALDARLHEDELLYVGPEGVDDLWAVLYDERYPGIAHGHLVAFHALAHIGSGQREEPSWISAIQGRDQTGGRELVLTVNLAAGGRDSIEVRLVDIAFNSNQSIHEAFDRVRELPDEPVVVVAWGLFDCAVVDAYSSLPTREGDASDVTLVDYLTAMLNEPSWSGFVEPACEALYPEALPQGATSCEEFFEGALGEFATLLTLAEMDDRAWKRRPPLGSAFFAATGNAGLPFPMPPAGWPGIVGVEACTKSIPGRAVFSNAGAIPGLESPVVQALGAWFVAPDSRRPGQQHDPDDPLGYWGTSYAAPAAAVQYAAGRFELADASGEPLLLHGCSDEPN